MERRHFLRIGGTALGGLLLARTLPVFAGEEGGSPFAPWEGPPTELDDPRLRALAWASLAPSSHNTQPWLVELLDGNGLALHLDPERTLPEADPAHRQTMISQGAFLEAFALAAPATGHRAEISLFPEGPVEGAAHWERPVARIRLLERPGSAPEPLFAGLSARRTNKRTYGEEPLAPELLDALEAEAERPGLRTLRFTGANERAWMTDRLAEAMAIEVSSEARNRELARWFRFSSEEIEQRRDGFSVAAGGVTGFRRWVAETFFLSREGAADPEGSFAKTAVKQVREQAGSSPAFGVLVSEENSRSHQVEAGRAFLRVHLRADALGLALHPMNQVNGGYGDMADHYARFHSELGLGQGEFPQMVYRLGRAAPVPHTPRRAATAFLLA